MSLSRIVRLRTVALIDRGVDRLANDGIGSLIDDRSRDMDRRRFLTTSATSLAAAFLAGCDSGGPKSAERVLAYATRKNEVVEQWLLRHTSMDYGSPGAAIAGAKFPSYFVSRTVPMHNEAVSGAWRLEVSGLVRTPLSLTREQLVAMPRRIQRVNHFCVEGWNAVAEFGGVSVSDLANAAGVLPQASVVDFQSFDAGYHESWDIESALHPQTLIVYAKDGAPLTPAYGAPARVHSPIKLGYKNTKYLTRVVFQAERNGGYWSDRGYEWFGGT